MHTRAAAASEETMPYLFFAFVGLKMLGIPRIFGLAPALFGQRGAPFRAKCKGTSKASLKNDELDGICFRIFSFVPSSRILGLLDGS